jgi:hypothetical protein
MNMPSKFFFKTRISAATEPDAEVDIISMDVPLLTRMLELAREDIKSDAQLHEVLTRVIHLSKLTTRLTMDDYDAILGKR